MPYRELTMIDVKEVLRRWQADHSARKIAEETGTDRKTVARYTGYAEQLELPRDRPLTEAEVHEVAQCVQARALPPQARLVLGPVRDPVRMLDVSRVAALESGHRELWYPTIQSGCNPGSGAVHQAIPRLLLLAEPP